MNRIKEQRITPENLAMTRSVILRKLKILEGKLNKFRSSSPEKWAEEVGESKFSERSSCEDLLSSRSSSDESSSSKSAEEIIKTIAENEDFIKQKVGGIENELHISPNKVLSESFISLQDDIDRMTEGLIGLQEVIGECNRPLGSYEMIARGIGALKIGLKELVDITKFIINKRSYYKTLEDIQSSVEESLRLLTKIEKSLCENNSDNVENELNILKNKFTYIKKLLNEMQEHSLTLNEVNQELNDVRCKAKQNFDEYVKIPSKISVRRLNPEIFADLEEKHFKNLDSALGYKITDYILKREEDAIANLRGMYAESLARSTK